MAALEEVVIRTLDAFGISAFRRQGLIGVWTQVDGQPAKIAAAGVRVARGVSLHGVALNVGACLDGFRYMVPCGLRDAALTTMTQARGGPVDQAAVRRTLVASVGELMNADLRVISAPGPRSGEVSKPTRVVAPISVKGGRPS